MSFMQQRSGRSDWARRRLVSAPEALESRQVLSSGVPAYASPWLPSDLFVTNPITHQRELVNSSQLVNQNNPNSPGLSNQGKIVTGQDRQGDKWTITVHGPGQVIVTDTTPNDGNLGDDIDTIQLINTNPQTTYVTGNVIPSNTFPRIDTTSLQAITFTTPNIQGNASGTPLEPSSGVIKFNQLIDLNGVKSIELNGFSLDANVTPAVTSQTGIFLYGGVGVLSFDNIDANINTAVNSTPYQIVIGEPNTPLKVQPSIFINHVFNLVFNGATQSSPPTTPVTSPSVEFMINGVIRSFDMIASSQPKIPAGLEVDFPPVGTTGRTSVQATAVNTLNVHGSAKNLTLSRSPVPFSSESSGLNSLHKATFGGTADGLGIDVNGKIGKLTFKRGLGNPAGVFTGTAPNGLLEPTTTYGTPQGSTGYPAAGDLGGQIRAKNIKKLTVKPANVLTQTAQNPNLVQSGELGYPTYVTSPGYSLTNAVVTTSGSIGSVNIKGTPLNTEIKTGFDFTSYAAGLEGTRKASVIKALRAKRDHVNTVASATFRPANNHYSHGTGIAGPGQINKSVTGVGIDTNGKSGLGNTGAGTFARTVRLLPKSKK
jgi:hypothetical protein